MPDDHALREQLIKALQGGQAHATFDQAVDSFPLDKIGIRPPHQPHSAWELLEHLRISQRDILDFSLSADYRELNWPEEYWPRPASIQPADWHNSVRAFRKDLSDFQELIRDPARDLYQPFPWGQGQTLLREALLVIDHNAYHIGELVLVRRSLGAWHHK